MLPVHSRTNSFQLHFGNEISWCQFKSCLRYQKFTEFKFAIKMKSRISGTVAFGFLECAVFLGLLIISIFFAKGVVEEYSAGHTQFSLTKKPWTVDHLPTVTVCIMGTRKLIYREEILISGFNRKINFLFSLKEGKNPVPGMATTTYFGSLF